MGNFGFASKANRAYGRTMTRRKNPLFAVSDAPEGASGAEAQADIACPGCPISMVMDTFAAAQPEALDHLLGAASEALAALQVVLDAAQDTIDAHRAALQTRAAQATAPPAKKQTAAPRRNQSQSPLRKVVDRHRVQHIDLG